MNNPKAARAVADGKPPLDYLESAVCDPSEARVMFSGAQKYGRRNFRDSTIKATTYVGALRRHVNAFASGEDIDPDSGEPHLAHIRACCAVLMSAQDAGTYHDDRREQFSLTPQYHRGVDELAEELGADAKAPSRPKCLGLRCTTPATCSLHRRCVQPGRHRGVDDLTARFDADSKAPFCAFKGGDCETPAVCRWRHSCNAKRLA